MVRTGTSFPLRDAPPPCGSTGRRFGRGPRRCSCGRGTFGRCASSANGKARRICRTVSFGVFEVGCNGSTHGVDHLDCDRRTETAAVLEDEEVVLCPESLDAGDEGRLNGVDGASKLDLPVELIATLEEKGGIVTRARNELP